MDEPRIIVCCTGVGIFNRGIESFCRELFDGLCTYSQLDVHLLKGRGENTKHEHVVRCLPRTGRIADIAGKMIRRNAYVAEQLSSFPAIVHQLRKLNPSLMITSDANVMFQIYRWRKQLGLHALKLVFSNGGPCHPPFVRTDFVHQVASHYYNEAINSGEPLDKHYLVPYGITVPIHPPFVPKTERNELRRILKVPESRPIVLSVGWISATHKRMDYVVKEIAEMPAPRPYLIMLGAMDETTMPIVALARELLGEDGFAARSVPYEDVGKYYQIADVFVLASLKEGFGRVYLEALMYGLPTIAHDHSVMRYVLGDVGDFLDLNKRSNLAEHLVKLFAQTDVFSAEKAIRRYNYVKSTFSWEALVPEYVNMFKNFHQITPLW